MSLLIKPTLKTLPSYCAALKHGWSPDNLRPEAATEELQKIAHAPEAFIASCDDRAGVGAPILLPDGSMAKRLPSFTRWMWDDDFCGRIGVRWQPGTPELPTLCLGHIGYSVVPWQRQKGYATHALRLLLEEIRPLGLPYVSITTDPDNIASQKVILANGGRLLERFQPPALYGYAEALRFRIDLM